MPTLFQRWSYCVTGIQKLLNDNVNAVVTLILTFILPSNCHFCRVCLQHSLSVTVGVLKYYN